MSNKNTLGFLGRRNNFEDKMILESINQIFEKKRGYSFKMPEKGGKVVLILSGGMDSVCLWFMLLHKYKLQVYPIYFFHKKTEYRERWKSVDLFSDIFSRRFPKQAMPVKKYPIRIGFSLGHSLKKKPQKKNDLKLLIPNLYYDLQAKTYRTSIISNPARINIFTISAYEYILSLRFDKNIDITTIFIGLTPEDSKATRESTLTTLRTINLSFCLEIGDFRYQIQAPLDRKNEFYFRKKDLLLYALRNRIPVEKTWSCDEDRINHCGRCISCRTRKEVFRSIRTKDKTKYAPILERAPVVLTKKIKRLVQFGLNRLKRKFSKKVRIDKVGNNSRFLIRPEIIWEEVQGETIRYNKKTGDLNSINETGNIIWCHIAKNPCARIGDCILEVKKHYPGVAKATLYKDIRAFLIESLQKGYVTSTKN